MQHFVRNVFAKFKVDRLSRFRTGARQVFTTQKPFRSEISSNHENCNIKFTLKYVFYQITICQISFEIYDAKQIYTREKK